MEEQIGPWCCGRVGSIWDGVRGRRTVSGSFAAADRQCDHLHADPWPCLGLPACLSACPPRASSVPFCQSECLSRAALLVVELCAWVGATAQFTRGRRFKNINSGQGKASRSLHVCVQHAVGVLFCKHCLCCTWPSGILPVYAELGRGWAECMITSRAAAGLLLAGGFNGSPTFWGGYRS